MSKLLSEARASSEARLVLDTLEALGYTDGITEATNAEDEDYGRSRLLDVLKDQQGAAAAEVCRIVLSDVRRFSL